MYLTLWRYPHVLRTSTIRRAENQLDPFIRFDTIPACGIGTAEHSTYLYSIAAQRRAVKKTVKERITEPNLAECAATEQLADTILASDQRRTATWLRNMSRRLILRTGGRPKRTFDCLNVHKQ